MKIKPCEQCQTLTHNARFCSLSCFAIKTNSEAPRRPLRERHLCDHCQTPTLNKRFCSSECFNKSRQNTSRKRRLEDRPVRKRTCAPVNECQVCGALTANVKYCSRLCTSKAQIKSADWHAERIKAARKRANEGRKAIAGKSHGLTRAQRKALFDIGDGQCALCGEREARVIDHCHETGQVRGLLCHKCNMGLGALGDNVQGLLRGVQYLQKSSLNNAIGGSS